MNTDLLNIVSENRRYSARVQNLSAEDLKREPVRVFWLRKSDGPRVTQCEAETKNVEPAPFDAVIP